MSWVITLGRGTSFAVLRRMGLWLIVMGNNLVQWDDRCSEGADLGLSVMGNNLGQRDHCFAGADPGEEW